MGVKTVVCFLLSTAIAIVLGLVTSNIIGVGTGVTIQQTTQSVSAAKEVSMLDTLINIIPNNPFEALSKQNLLQIIFFALILGFSLMKIGEPAKPLLDMFRAGQEAMKEITNIVLEFTPYGVKLRVLRDRFHS
ncbi:MAG: cation:dicarboxylase symporter family transporter [Synergistaceae bacterium]|nr:cation:dicarboxylase symporter family transporter [Synergistaceae bacterium]